MKIRRLTDNLLQLTRQGWVNAYLVREDEGLTLIDTSLSRSGRAIRDAARAAGAPITRIVLTHGHGDHVGSLDELHTALPDVPVALHELDARVHAGETVVDGKLTGSWPQLSTIPDQRLTGGERIGSLEVVPSPGHSPGHVALLDTRDRSLIAGDVFSSLGGLAVTNHLHWRFPFPGFATFDKDQDLASARALRALDPTLLVVGHGPAVRTPGAVMDRAIAQAAR